MRYVIAAVLFVTGCGGAAKAPHLVVTATGEDLGEFLGEPDCVWNAQAEGVFCYSHSSCDVVFQSTDCSGMAYSQPLSATDLCALPDGRLFKAGADSMVTAQSTAIWTEAGDDITCSPLSPSVAVNYQTMVDTGAVVHAHAHNELSVSVQ